MAKKRRTKKDKINPKRPISISWKPTTSEANVKRQLSTSKPKETLKKNVKKHARHTDKNSFLASVKKDLVKSLFFASLIVASEVVVYLVWK